MVRTDADRKGRVRLQHSLGTSLRRHADEPDFDDEEGPDRLGRGGDEPAGPGGKAVGATAAVATLVPRGSRLRSARVSNPPRFRAPVRLSRFFETTKAHRSPG